MRKWAFEALTLGLVIGGLIWMAFGLTTGGWCMIAVAAVFAILSIGGK